MNDLWVCDMLTALQAKPGKRKKWLLSGRRLGIGSGICFTEKTDVLKTYLRPELDALSNQVGNIEASPKQVGLKLEICLLRVPRNMLFGLERNISS